MQNKSESGIQSIKTCFGGRTASHEVLFDTIFSQLRTCLTKVFCVPSTSRSTFQPAEWEAKHVCSRMLQTVDIK